MVEGRREGRGKCRVEGRVEGMVEGRVRLGRVSYPPPPNPNPVSAYSAQSPPLHPPHPYPSPLLHYHTLLGYIMLGKDERYDGMVLEKDRFSKDVSLCYHEISLQSI